MRKVGGGEGLETREGRDEISTRVAAALDSLPVGSSLVTDMSSCTGASATVSCPPAGSGKYSFDIDLDRGVIFVGGLVKLNSTA